MRELKLVNDESTDTSLVLADESGEQYFLVVDDALRGLLNDPEAARLASVSEVTVVDESAPQAAADSTTATNEDGEDTSEPEESPKPENSPGAVRSRSLPEPDPLYSAPLSLRPRDIQTRIRAGASAQELADEMGVAVSRVEVYAHPVLLERSQIAQLARASHPVREDGPATLTLAEVLAAAFGARGHSLAEATWDAFREPAGEWIVRVSWQAGLSENSAEWILKRHSASSATTEPRNAVAADLTDPDFVQPVRSLTSISRGTRYDEPMPARRPRPRDEEEHFPADDADNAESADDAVDAEAEADAAPDTATDDVAEGADFLEHPDAEEPKPTKRRRKAVTPHWEDVLLGVRTNTKRPKN